MKNPLLCFAAFLIIASCASKKKMITRPVADGSSFDKAIVINETSERKGVDDEYVWIRKNYPGAKNSSQALMNHNKKTYDLLHITTADGRQLSIYFDISNFYGKW